MDYDSEKRKRQKRAELDAKLRSSRVVTGGQIVYGTMAHERIEKEAKKLLKEEYDEKIKNMPKVFDYYCQACLYQTNEYSRVCPKCYEGRLLKTERER